MLHAAGIDSLPDLHISSTIWLLHCIQLRQDREPGSSQSAGHGFHTVGLSCSSKEGVSGGGAECCWPSVADAGTQTFSCSIPVLAWAALDVLLFFPETVYNAT